MTNMRKTLLLIAAMTLLSTTAMAKVKGNTSVANGGKINTATRNGGKINTATRNGVETGATGVVTTTVQAVAGRLIVR
jgi:hypothetical protein